VAGSETFIAAARASAETGLPHGSVLPPVPDCGAGAAQLLCCTGAGAPHVSFSVVGVEGGGVQVSRAGVDEGDAPQGSSEDAGAGSAGAGAVQRSTAGGGGAFVPQ
jgi:hypothetical protein